MRIVFPVTPSFERFDEDDEVFSLDLTSTDKYIKYVEENYDNPTLMTTAGTSQFNLLTNSEIRLLNRILIMKCKTKPIIGIPALSYVDTIKELNFYNEDECYPMLLFPERFYTEDNLCEFFERCADFSKNPIYIHGMWMRKGNGGNWDYTASVINRLAKHPNIKGMKEETSNIDLAYKVLQDVTEDFDIIVAGGSMKRHWNLSNAKSDISLLSGVGSIFPEVANQYATKYNAGDLHGAKDVMNEFEKPLFKTFMDIGWHASLRHALNKMGYIRENRYPFIEINSEQKDRIDTIISELKSKI